ncbi:hypothetical protein B0O99DRAFT_611822 [Bisporella sp. PMI_857]|nr:hypothetical protein B0O99DRAFT_611822 [Bisporella sp. PMI_857]
MPPYGAPQAQISQAQVMPQQPYGVQGPQVQVQSGRRRSQAQVMPQQSYPVQGPQVQAQTSRRRSQRLAPQGQTLPQLHNIQAPQQSYSVQGPQAHTIQQPPNGQMNPQVYSVPQFSGQNNLQLLAPPPQYRTLMHQNNSKIFVFASNLIVIVIDKY